MKKFDVIVIGSGSGLDVASAVARRGLKVAVVEDTSLGGTCLNRGCVPSKMLIHRADIVEQIKNSEEFKIEADIKNIDFPGIINEINSTVSEDSEQIRKGLRSSQNHTLYHTEGKFIDERTLKVGNEKIKGEKVIVAAGSRPYIPPIKGIEQVDYITSKEALKLEKQPEHLVIIGGGFIAAEMGHFYGSLGTDITIIGRRNVLLPDEDKDVSKTFTRLFRKKYDIYTGYEASEVSQDNGKFTVTAQNGEKEEEIEVSGDTLLVATGRRPNTDKLAVENAGIETDDRGFIKTNEYLETTAENVWALGDIVGNYLFKHTANLEAEYVFFNAFTDHKHKVDYTAIPHAVFSSPQVASVGKTQQEMEKEGKSYVVNQYEYQKTAMGSALKEDNGFVKVLAHPKEGTIFGCHIIGPHASILIHEVEIVMRSGGTVSTLRNAIITHPALSEVVQRAFTSL